MTEITTQRLRLPPGKINKAGQYLKCKKGTVNFLFYVCERGTDCGKSWCTKG